MRTIRTYLKNVLVTGAVLFFTAAFVRADVFDWENYQSDIHGVAEQFDPNVINPWGMAVSPSGNIWVNDNGTGVATVYYQDGTPFPNSSNPLVVNTASTSPTGIVSNTTSFFKVTNGTNTLPARFIFVGEDGIISGWNQQLNSNTAFVARNNAATAIYKGATLGVSAGHNFLYVTNFKSGQVETYNENFNPVAFPFTDPNLPPGYAPFGIRNFNGQIFVTFVPRSSSNPNDEQAGPGNGIVDVFKTNGQFVRRLVTGGRLNAPWGLAVVAGNLWVGNFGDGRINVYNPTNGTFAGTPKDIFGTPLDFDGLWDLVLADGGLFFSAGIVDEQHGIFGVIFSE